MVDPPLLKLRLARDSFVMKERSCLNDLGLNDFMDFRLPHSENGLNQRRSRWG